MTTKRSTSTPTATILAAALLLCGLLAPPVAALPHARQGRCHCPCSLTCGNGVGTDCNNHSEDCHYAHCVDVGAINIGELFPGLEVHELGATLPSGYVEHVPWFSLDLPQTILVGIGARDRESGTETSYVFTFRLDDPLAGTYSVDSPADPTAWEAWVASIDPDRDMGVSIGITTDPATWRIVDGDLGHLNESLRWRFHLVVGGKDIVFMRKDSTPAWEAWTYLHSALEQLPDDAFRTGLDPVDCRARLSAMLDTFHVLVEGSFFDRARQEVTRMHELCADWLVPDHRLTAPTLGALSKVENLLTPSTNRTAP